MMNVMYKERFPKATRQMEERLGHYITEHKSLESSRETCDALPIVRFVHHQVLEMARDCLHKSQAKLISSRYFYEMSENLERLLAEVYWCIVCVCIYLCLTHTYVYYYCLDER